MDEKDLKIQALEFEVAEAINAKIALRQQLLAYQNYIQDKEEEEGE